MKTMWNQLKNPDSLLIAWLVFLLLMLPVAVQGNIYESWKWYWLVGEYLALIGFSLYAGSWCARRYGVRRVNGWFLRAWMRKSLLVVFAALIAANLAIRNEIHSWFDGSDSDSDPTQVDDTQTPEVPNCADGLEADLAFYENWNKQGELVRLRATPSELLALRRRELGCDGELTEAQQSRLATLDQALSSALDALSEEERADRAAALQRQQDRANAAAPAPQTFEVTDYTELDFEPSQGPPPSPDDLHDIIDDSRGAPAPGFDRRTVYRQHKISDLFPRLLFGVLGIVFSGGLTRTTIVEETVEGVATNSFDVEEAVQRLTPLLEGLSVDDRLRLKDLIAAELEAAVIKGKMLRQDADAIFSRIADVTTKSAANDEEAKFIRDAEAICAGLLDGKVPSESVKSILVTNPLMVQQVSTCIRNVLPESETRTVLLGKLNDWGN